MSVLRKQREFKEKHQTEHERDITPKLRGIFCQQCYPTSRTNIPETFKNFWTWITEYCYAITYTSISVVTLKVFISIYESELPTGNYVNYRIASYAYKLLGSLTYSRDPFDELWVYYLINLTPRVNYFKEPVEKRTFKELQRTICLEGIGIPLNLKQQFEDYYNEYILQEENLNNMDEDQIKTLLTTLLGPDGLDIKKAGTDRKELSIVKVEPFYGKETEDPYEWLEAFEQAALANQWTRGRRVEIAPGYLRDAARDWYISNRDGLNYWSDWRNEEEENPIYNIGFKTRFLEYFTPETKQNQWYHELMTIRQFANEKVDDYSRRFKKLLRKVNFRQEEGPEIVPAILQVRMYLFGLSPLLTPLVATDNPTTLEEAIERAKTVEVGYNYVPTKQVNISTGSATHENPSLGEIMPTTASTSNTSKADVDSLADQLQKLTLNYANLASTLLAQNKKDIKPTPATSVNRRKPITCYKCGKEGHIARECYSQERGLRRVPGRDRTYQFNRRNDQNTRRVNYVEKDSDIISSEEEYEYEIYENDTEPPRRVTRSGKKRVRTGEEMDENDDYIELPEAPITPLIPPASNTKKGKGRARKFKLRPAPIEDLTELDIVNYIRNLPSGLTIGQASAQYPKYRSAVRKSVQRRREANYIGEDSQTTTAARCDIYINNEKLSAVVDSGAATSIMTKKLMDKLGYKINEPSKLTIVTANGSRIRSLGKINRVPLELEDEFIPTTFQVLDSVDDTLILGNDWLQKVQAVLNWKKGTLTIHGANAPLITPIRYTRENQESSDSSEISSSDEYESEDDLEEATIYYSETSSSDIEDLEYNPWRNYTPPLSPEPEMELTSDEESEEKDNPAIYIAQVAEGEEKKTLNLGPLTAHQQQLFNNLTQEYRDICAKNQTDIGRTNITKHKILTGDATPISQVPYRMSPQKKEFLRQEIANMEKDGIIRKSTSPWASPVVIVDKKDGTYRICIDYRKLNKVTKPDAFPLPRIDDMLESFGGAQWFTTLDLASGYWQVEMNAEDVEKTAFVTPFGLYEFLVMPFGLSYAPATFQRLMNRVLQEFLGDFVAVYLDDVIIFTKGTFEQHMDHLQQVFEALRITNLKIKLKKCHFCLPNIHFLGHVVGRDGIKPDPGKIEKVKNYPIPTNLTELRAALGLFSYYRKFIKDFSRIAKPMNVLLKKDIPYV